MEKIDLVPGKKYKGTFWLNEYGQIQVQAEQKVIDTGLYGVIRRTT